MTQSVTLQGKRVLVVEDEFLVALDIEAELEDCGASVVCASTLAQARAKAEGGAFDAVVLDLNLHGEASYPVADLLHERQVPFVFHTGQGEKAVLTRRYPGVTVCSKPCDGRSLANSLGRVISMR
ncbi:response regulator [Aureimonas jatrophae]|nr:response regulator [Aureimonas jatrophae]MBB3948768.1 CheY-like chemotaxis protein [Aureimonas jatrophae]